MWRDNYMEFIFWVFATTFYLKIWYFKLQNFLDSDAPHI